MSERVLTMYSVYDHPTDYPDMYVARLSNVTIKGFTPTDILIKSPCLKTLRNALSSMGLERMERSKLDDPTIIEVWL